MADIYNDGNVAAWFVATIADISAPKAATEIGAASTLALHTRLTPDGLKTPASTDTIDNSKLASTFTTKRVGRRKFDGLSLKYIKGDATAEQLFDTTLIYHAQGFLVVRRGILATVAPTAAQKVEVYPVECEEPIVTDPMPNTLQEVTVNLVLISDPRTVSNPAILGT